VAYFFGRPCIKITYQLKFRKRLDNIIWKYTSQQRLTFWNFNIRMSIRSTWTSIMSEQLNSICVSFIINFLRCICVFTASVLFPLCLVFLYRVKLNKYIFLTQSALSSSPVNIGIWRVGAYIPSSWYLYDPLMPTLPDYPSVDRRKQKETTSAV